MLDFLIVGSGVYGAVMAQRIRQAGYTCLVLEKRNQIGGNCFTQQVEGIQVHCYGAHIFHTSKEEVWKFETVTESPTVRKGIANRLSNGSQKSEREGD